MHAGACEFRIAERDVLRVALKVKPGAHESYVWVECSGCDCGWQVPVFAAEGVG
jgi:hypothetical protein